VQGRVEGQLRTSKDHKTHSRIPPLEGGTKRGPVSEQTQLSGLGSPPEAAKIVTRQNGQV